MAKTNKMVIEECNKEISIFSDMIVLTKQLIELTENKDKYFNYHMLSDFKEELENHIKTYEFSIKERLFKIFKLKNENPDCVWVE